MVEDGSKDRAHADDEAHAPVKWRDVRTEPETGDLAHYAQKQTGHPAARKVHGAADRAADWRQRGAAAADVMHDVASNLYDQACEFAHEEPMRSAAIALTAGYLAGRLLGSRR